MPLSADLQVEPESVSFDILEETQSECLARQMAIFSIANEDPEKYGDVHSNGKDLASYVTCRSLLKDVSAQATTAEPQTPNLEPLMFITRALMDHIASAPTNKFTTMASPSRTSSSGYSTGTP